jgi:protein-S-isoprenylcysteine O-methyltransferase Ste14
MLNVLLFTAFGLHHSVMARSGAKQALARLVPPALERSTYVWVASALFLAVCGWWQPVPGELYRLDGAAAAVGYGAQALGIALTVRASSAIDMLDLAGIRPALRDPGADPRRHVPLETTGLYALVRHPLYFAWVLLVFGAPHMTGTRLAFALVSTAYLALAVPLEERSLIRVFGDEYRAYQRKVRWRMVPGLY